MSRHELKMTKADARNADIYDILGQRKWWKSGDGAVTRRRDLHINHKLNIMAKLLRDSQDTAFAYACKPVFLTAPDSVSAELDWMMREPELWMAGTKMFRALLQDVMAFCDIGPEDLGLQRLGLIGELTYPGASIHTPVWAEKR